ncbi:hypothetical protein N8T08_006696 [Aspergillus melleus]|uniref:Uncharacterized protein n=1 Tax=Aspergillus melleus TaxID=138277 RepID=A0ACC3AZL8_9EURO|nr:hypothetical protein N8T08_006696 [Aspergillus melleus]
MTFNTLMGVDPSLDHRHHFETSWLLPPLAFASLRALVALYIFVTNFFIWGWDGTHGDRAAIGQSFSYFTWLTYWGLGFYYLVACVHTACYARSGRSVLFDACPRGLRALHSLFYTTITTFPFLVTIVFWAILYSGPWYSVTFTGWSNGFYPYSFLNPGVHGEKSGLVSGYCFGILAAILVIFALSWGAIWLRRSLTRGGVQRSRFDRERTVEMEEVSV